MNNETTKAQVVNAVGNILVSLGKGDINRVRDDFLKASQTFEKWVADRPEREKQKLQETNPNGNT